MSNIEIKNKYIPLHKPWISAFTKEKDGLYYIAPLDYIAGINGDSYIYENTNYLELAENRDELDLIICGQHWAMEVVDGNRVIPFDTFVDEILPLVGIDPSTVVE